MSNLCRIYVETMSNLCRNYVECMSNSYPKNSFGHEKALQTAIWAENLCTLHSFSRGIRFWHSRGLVPTKNRQKNTKPIFSKNCSLQKNTKPKKGNVTQELSPKLDFRLPRCPKQASCIFQVINQQTASSKQQATRSTEHTTSRRRQGGRREAAGSGK